MRGAPDGRPLLFTVITNQKQIEMKANGKEKPRLRKCLFIDLDGTLITTRSGSTFPQGIWDMELRLDVLDAIKALQPEFVGVVTNQGGIEAGHVDIDSFIIKINYICTAVEEYTGVLTDYALCVTNNPNHTDRKPNTGMLQRLNCIHGDDSGNRYGPWPVEECLMVGDASGLEGQWSDSDRRTAEKYGCDYMDVEEFIACCNTIKKEGVL